LECNNITRNTINFFDREIRITEDISKIGCQNEEVIPDYACERCGKKVNAKIIKSIASYP
jgi:hypothetical protein